MITRCWWRIRPILSTYITNFCCDKGHCCLLGFLNDLAYLLSHSFRFYRAGTCTISDYQRSLWSSLLLLWKLWEIITKDLFIRIVHANSHSNLPFHSLGTYRNRNFYKSLCGIDAWLLLNLSLQEQSSERNLPGTIVPCWDIFDNDVMIFEEHFWKFLKVIRHKKADKILHLTSPPLPHRPLFEVL